MTQNLVLSALEVNREVGKIRAIREKMHDIRMWTTRRKWKKEYATKEEAQERATKEQLRKQETACELAAKKTMGLCAHIVRDAGLSDVETNALKDGLGNMYVSSKYNSDKDQIHSDLAAKGLLETVPSKNPLIHRYLLTGKGNCVAKVASGEAISECDCALCSAIGTDDSSIGVEDAMPKRKCKCTVCGAAMEISGNCKLPDNLIKCLPCYKKPKGGR